jgi:hypothetical protein
MAVLQNPLIGRTRQKLGGSVFTTWKGINVLKGKPLSVANPNSDLQQMRRSALRQSTAIARAISAAIDLGFKEQAVHKSAFNAFVGYMLRHGFNFSSPPNATLLPSAVLVSQGTISVTTYNTIQVSESGNDITANWDTSNLLPGQSMSDKIYAVLYDADTATWQASPDSFLRSAGTGDWHIADGSVSVGESCFVYLFAYNSTSRKSSDSSAQHVVVIA